MFRIDWGKKTKVLQTGNDSSLGQSDWSRVRNASGENIVFNACRGGGREKGMEDKGTQTCSTEEMKLHRFSLNTVTTLISSCRALVSFSRENCSTNPFDQ